MGATDRDITWIQTQLTMGRWYLDAAASASAEFARNYLERARRTYEGILQSLSQLDLSSEERELIGKAVSTLGERIAATEPG
jgi:hypothetical protein